jgi:hypothetical protein
VSLLPTDVLQFYIFDFPFFFSIHQFTFLFCNKIISFPCNNSREKCLNNSRQKSLIDEHKILFAQISTHHISPVGYKLMSLCIILFYLFSGGIEEIKIFSNNISNLIRSHKKYNEKRERLLKFTQH